MKLFQSCFLVLFLYPELDEAVKNKNQSFDKDLNNFQEELAKNLKIKKHKLIDPEKFNRFLEDLNITVPDTRAFLVDKTVCGVCLFLVDRLQQKQLPIKVLAEVICNIYITLRTLSISDFCEDLIKLNVPILEYIVENSNILDSELACSVLLQNNRCYFNKPALKWRSRVPSKAHLKIPRVNQNPTAKPLKILHLSDFHIAPDYEIGGVEDCGYPLCCKKDLGNKIFGANAGVWGDYNCDIPLWLFGQTMLHINHTHKDIDLVYFTGDIIDHTVWKANITENSNIIYFTFKTLFETFPKIPVLPIIGNHEAAPLNVYAPSEYGIESAGLSNQWLYTLLSKLWRTWLPKESQRTVAKQGYYSYMVNKKLKIIALNNNICYIFNWWVLYNTTFLNEQLHFLSSELETAEINEQFVHILMHIPVGNKECIEPWEASYNNLVKRFSHIIKGQFYGHTHTDELKVFYDENRNPINVGYNGASLTPYVKFNPNYKVMVVDPNNYDVLDVHTYYFNLTEANQYPNRSPRWLKLYSMKDAYGLNNLSPQSVNELALNLFTNETLFQQYWRYYVRDGDDSLKDGCNKECKDEITCKVVTTESLKSDVPNCTK